MRRSRNSMADTHAGGENEHRTATAQMLVDLLDAPDVAAGGIGRKHIDADEQRRELGNAAQQLVGEHLQVRADSQQHPGQGNALEAAERMVGNDEQRAFPGDEFELRLVADFQADAERIEDVLQEVFRLEIARPGIVDIA